jgi:hypothetical protein
MDPTDYKSRIAAACHEGSLEPWQKKARDRRQSRCDICGAEAAKQCGHTNRDGSRCSIRLCLKCAGAQPVLCADHAEKGNGRR